jgi:hypothetical protein
MKFPRWLSKPSWFTIFIGLFVVFSLFVPIVTFANPFSTTITIKEKNNYSAGRYMKNIVMDTTGKIYTVDNMYLVVNFDAISKYSALEPGKTYHVSGYGITIPFLQMYPNITQISPA